jgi:hypothetical protein
VSVIMVHSIAVLLASAPLATAGLLVSS